MTVPASSEETKVGNYFVSNYPPFSFWSDAGIPALHEVLAGKPDPQTPLGLYVHLPFCRRRCDFCYFKVYTEKSSQDIRNYLASVLAEVDQWVKHPYVAGRKPQFIYFGGGTPSYLSAAQLTELFEGIQSRISWDDAVEVAFECEPGTLSEPKIEVLRKLGVTRLSIGVENFNPEILERNNRAHRAKEIYAVYDFARKVGFSQINLDLIAGMVGETEENWKHCLDETVRLEPESVTIYQMEVPHNTTLSARVKESGGEVAPVADWATKRRWISEAFGRLESVGYHIGSAYTACRNDEVKFLYRDALWHGADLLGVGVSSFSHLGGVHFQNQPSLEPYSTAVAAGELPIWRALRVSDDERFIREFILQMKLGHVDATYFVGKFGVNPTERFDAELAKHRDAGYLSFDREKILATREGLLRIDSLLHDFFLEEHRGARYT